MRLADITKSAYFKSEDFAQPRQLIIESVQQLEIGQDQNKKMETVLFFRGEERGLILKTTNIHILADIAGSSPDDDIAVTWPGLKIEVFRDPSVMFKGQRTGGIRIRPVSHAAPAHTPRQQQTRSNMAPPDAVTDETEIPDPGPPMRAGQRGGRS